MNKLILMLTIIVVSGCVHTPTEFEPPEELEQRFFDISWTAYKYPINRVAVTGMFDDVEIKSMGTIDSITPLSFLENGHFEIRTNSANIGNNTERNNNIRNFFFRYMAPTIIGKVTEVKNDTVTVDIEMNFITMPIQFTTTTSNDSILILEGKISNMTDFNWQYAYDNLQRVCGEHHQNHISNDIDLKATFRLPQ